MGSEIGGGKLFSCSGFGFRPRPRAGVASCKCQPPTPGWWLGSGADPGTPSGLGPGGSSLLGGRERRGGHRVLAQPGPAQSSQPPRPRRIDGPPPRRQVRGLGPAEVGTRGRRGLGADWGGAAPGRSNFSGTRGRLARPGGEPGPEWGFLVRGSEFRFPWAPRQGMWRSSVRCAPESWPASCGVPLSVTERPVCRRACPPTSGAPECLCRG